MGALAVTVALAACSGEDPFLPREPVAGAILRVHSLNGSPVGTPNALALVGSTGSGALRPIALAASPNFLFDVAVDFEEDGAVLMYPVSIIGSVFGGARDVGFRRYDTPFEDLVTAPTDGYVFGEPMELAVGDVFAAVAINSPVCVPGFVLIPNIHAKLRVDEIDHATRSVVLRIVADASCGFRRLTVAQSDN